MLWAVGAAIAWFIRRDAAQLALVAVLTPAWLLAEWTDYTRWGMLERGGRPAACFAFLTALAYFTASSRRTD